MLLHQNRKWFCQWDSDICFNDISVNASSISVRSKTKRQRIINTVTFYLRDVFLFYYVILPYLLFIYAITVILTVLVSDLYV